MKKVNLGYNVEVSYEVVDDVVLFNGNEFNDHYEVFALVAQNELIPNITPMTAYEYTIEDRDMFLAFKEAFQDIMLIAGAGTVYKNRQYLSFDYNLFIDKDRYVVDGVDFFDWFIKYLK
ncbi:TPA: hypothetical protein ACN35C_004700 [Vibrio parahaemolyticus]